MLNPEGSLHGGCAAFLIDAYVSSPPLCFFFDFPIAATLPHFSGYTSFLLWELMVVLLDRCTTLVFLAATCRGGVSSSMNVVYHAPAAP